MIVEFVESWCTETCRIGGTETEITRGIHQRSLRREMVVECLVMSIAQAKSQHQITSKFSLMLGIGRQRIDIFVYISRCSCKILLAPVGSEDGCRMLRKTENRFHVAFHHTLFLRLHIVTNSIGIRLHIVLLAIAEPVDRKIGLQRVLGIELIDTTQVPAEALIAHLVIVATRNVLTGFRTIGNLI